MNRELLENDLAMVATVLVTAKKLGLLLTPEAKARRVRLVELCRQYAEIDASGSAETLQGMEPVVIDTKETV